MQRQEGISLLMGKSWQVLFSGRRGCLNYRESYRDPRKFDYDTRLARAWKLQNGTPEGGTRIWTRDLLICSQMLYPWAIPPAVTQWPQLTPLCFCSYIWTLPTSAVPTMGSNTHGHSRLVFVLWNPTGLPLQVGVTIDLVSLQPTPGSVEVEALWPRKCRGWGPFGLPGETAGCPEPSHTSKLGSEPSLPR